MDVLTGKDATIKEILVLGYDSYRKNHNVPKHVEKAVYDQLSCRTVSRGYHAEYCPNDDYIRSHFNSCHNRICPQCNSIGIDRWLKKQESRLIGCDHFHATFTIAHEYNPIWLHNKKEMGKILFQAARDVTFRLLVTGKYLGALPGIIGSLHTWTKTELLHPHVHFLITGGGLTEDGEWKPSTNGFLIPIKLAMKIFRTLFRWRVRQAIRKGIINLPTGMTYKDLTKINKITGKKKWNVYIEEKFSNGKGVLKYIVRYLKGGSISNHRILKVTETHVTISYADSKDRDSEGKRNKKTMTLTIEEFIGRYLLHVPWPRIQQVRYYGIYSIHKGAELDKCRSILGQPPVEEPEFLKWEDYLSLMGVKHPTTCPICGTKLIHETRIEKRANFPPILVFLKRQDE